MSNTNTDAKFQAIAENKVEKAMRNNETFKAIIDRARKGEYDEDIEFATNEDFLKVYERFSIREMFSLTEGKDYYKLYKEVFYIQDPHKYYIDTVDETIYRRIASQKEEGDKEWAEAIAKELNLDIVKRSKNS